MERGGEEKLVVSSGGPIYNGFPSSGLRKACVCLCVSVTKTAFLDDSFDSSRRGINAFRVASLAGALTEAHAALRMSFEVAFSTPATRQLHHSIGTGVVQHARRRAVMQRKVQAWRSQQRARHVCRR